MHILSSLRRRYQQICLRSNKILANINNSIRWNTSLAADNSILPNVHRIILIRHGESLGNIDERAYESTADWRIPLTKKGREQASLAGKKVASHLSIQTDDDSREVDLTKGRVFLYVSPYLRTRQTLREILREVPKDSIIGIREDPRIAEQQFGNFQNSAIQDNKAKRTDFGRFFYRFPSGESGFDVYNRISGFLGTMQRDASDEQSSKGEGMTICIVTHGLALRLFLMRWFQYTVHEFERSYNPKNGRVVVLEQAKGGGFELSAADRLAMGFPTYKDQERFRLMNDYELLDRSGW
jgi:broad specificity phosphatase PhoE